MKKPALALATVAACAATCLALTGCGNVTHQAVAGVDTCLSCHTAEYYVEFANTYSTDGAVACTTGAVDVIAKGATTIYVCSPVATSRTDGAMAVPVTISTKRATEGQPVTIELADGDWMVVIQGSGKVSSQMITVTNTGAGENPVITLKL